MNHNDTTKITADGNKETGAGISKEEMWFVNYWTQDTTVDGVDWGQSAASSRFWRGAAKNKEDAERQAKEFAIKENGATSFTVKEANKL